jgi:hypothetical protein
MLTAKPLKHGMAAPSKERKIEWGRCVDINKARKQGKKERGEQPHALDVFD